MEAGPEKQLWTPRMVDEFLGVTPYGPFCDRKTALSKVYHMYHSDKSTYHGELKKQLAMLIGKAKEAITLLLKDEQLYDYAPDPKHMFLKLNPDYVHYPDDLKKLKAMLKKADDQLKAHTDTVTKSMDTQRRFELAKANEERVRAENSDLLALIHQMETELVHLRLSQKRSSQQNFAPGGGSEAASENNDSPSEPARPGVTESSDFGTESTTGSDVQPLMPSGAFKSAYVELARHNNHFPFNETFSSVALNNIAGVDLTFALKVNSMTSAQLIRRELIKRFAD